MYIILIKTKDTKQFNAELISNKDRKNQFEFYAQYLGKNLFGDFNQ